MIVRCFSEVADTEVAQVCSQQNGDASVSFSRDVHGCLERMKSLQCKYGRFGSCGTKSKDAGK